MSKNQRLYAPYIKIKGQKKWHRATFQDGGYRLAFTKENAIRIYQSWLLEPFLNPNEQNANQIRELRPIPVEYDCKWCNGTFKKSANAKYRGSYRAFFCSDDCFNKEALQSTNEPKGIE